jgi:hypothetical protein
MNKTLEKRFLKQYFFYQKLETGFIYGHIISFDTVNAVETKGWFKEEISKVALLNTLYGIFCITNDDSSPKISLSSRKLYNQMNPEGFSLLKNSIL